MESDYDELRERLAALEHEQWVDWSQSLAQSEELSEDRLTRWRQCWVDYDQLDEETKDHDRVWADAVIDILEDEGLL